MDYSIYIWEIVTFVLISLFSSIIYLRFEYQDTNYLYKLFIPKNDSLWERVKVLMFPALIMTIIECLLIKINPNFMFSKFVSLIVITIINPLAFIIFFSYSKWDMIVINVLTSITSALSGLLVSVWILSLPILTDIIIYISAIGILLIVLFYVCATFFQTDNLMFMDPVTKKGNLKKDN